MVDEYNIEGYKVYRYIMPVIASNMYIVVVGYKALIVDPHESREALKLLQKNGVQDVLIILTHEHYDHISGVNFFRKHFSCTVYGNRICGEYVKDPMKNMAAFLMIMFVGHTDEERSQLEKLVDENYSCFIDVDFQGNIDIEWEGIYIKLVETPGHSMGSICAILNDMYIFTGDSLLNGEKIITKFPGGSKKLYVDKTKPFLCGLNKNTKVFPGHGEVKLLKHFEIV